MNHAQPRDWRKSRYSSQQTACVEVGRVPGGAAVRDTKNREAGHIAVGSAQWVSFLGSLKSGALDR
ncbi:hypothetical protein GCM10027174_04580 [Salinifilum aidingensis]